MISNRINTIGRVKKRLFPIPPTIIEIELDEDASPKINDKYLSFVTLKIILASKKPIKYKTTASKIINNLGAYLSTWAISH
jgi:hypothetical protein